MILRKGPATGSNGAAPPDAGGERTALWRGWLRRSPNARGNTPGQVAQLLLFGLALLLALGAAVAPWNVVSRIDLPVGSVADRVLRAPRNLTYTSEART